MSRTHKWTIQKEEELRIYVPENAKFQIKLLNGDAEIFGYELVPNQFYKIEPETHIAVISWTGAVLEGDGDISHAYVSNENMCLINLNLHACLNQKRRDAKSKFEMGPRVLICGATDVGKSTLANILINYSIRSNFPIINVDLDIGQSDIVVPGALGAVLVDQPFLIGNEKSTHCPLAYFYGHTDMEVQADLYKFYVKQLSDSIFQKFEKSPKVKSSGFIVNTCGYILKQGLEILKYAIECFDIDLVIVIDSQLLYSQLKDLCHEPKYIVEIPKSGGAMNIDRKVRKSQKIECISSYFYGPEKNLHPHTSTFSFDELKFYKIGRPAVSEFCLPVGADKKKLNLEVLPVDPDEEMLYALCGMSCGESSDEILVSNVYGFIVITHVDMENKKVTIMSSGPQPFPSKKFVVGGIKHIDMQ